MRMRMAKAKPTDPRQLTLDVAPRTSARRQLGPAHVPDGPTSTSRQAASTTRAGTDEARVLRALHEGGPATDDALEIRLDMRHQTCSARRRGLVRKGLVRDTGERCATRTGRKAAVWELTEAGRHVVAALNEERG